MIYAAAVQITPHLLRHALLPGVCVGFAVALATVLGVAAAAHALLLPGLSWPAALLLGIVAALFDTRLFQEVKGTPHVPRALADALKAHEIASRVVALTALALVALTIRKGEAPDLGAATLNIAWALLGAAAAGFLIGRAVLWLRDRAGPAPVEIAVSLATPYLGALAARSLGLSLSVTIIAAALTVSAARVDPNTGEARSSAEARISAGAFWEEASLVVSAILFLLSGLALPEAVSDLGRWPTWAAVTAAIGILVIALTNGWLGSLVSIRLAPVAAALAEENAAGRAAAAGVMAWASTRSVLGLVVVLSVPTTWPDGTPFAERGLLLLVAALVILASIGVQGLTLRQAVRGAALRGGGDAEREKEQARTAAAEAREEVTGDDAVCPEGLAAERRELLARRERDEIGDDALRSLLREADLRRRAAEKDGKPGALPPRP